MTISQMTDAAKLEARLDAALALVRAEALRAMRKHTAMNSSHEAFGVIYEEFIIEFADEMKANDADKQATEMTQVGAMAVRALVDVYQFQVIERTKAAGHFAAGASGMDLDTQAAIARGDR